MTSSNPQQQKHKHLLGHRIADDRLELVSILGLGAYGVVYLARDLTHPLHKQQPFASSSSSDLPHILASQHGGAASGYYAVKCLNKVDLDSRQKKFQRREIVLHSMVTSHPSVVSLYRVIDNKDDPCIYVIMDFCPDGDLFSMITETQRYAVPTPECDDVDIDYDECYQAARADMDVMVKKVFTQILDAVQFCHVNGIYHRDLKPENILCLQGGAKVVLADFGLATHEKDSNDFGCGSTFYMGPECQGGISSNLKHYSTAANDVWSLGVILVNLVCGRNPWKQACLSDETFREYLRNPEFLMDILPISQQTNSLLKRVFTVRESWRCSLDELRMMIHQVTRFTATNAELRDRQKMARHAAQRAKEKATIARQAAETARREAELRHGVDQFYQGSIQQKPVLLPIQAQYSTDEYREEDILQVDDDDDEQVADAIEEEEESSEEYEGEYTTSRPEIDYFQDHRRASECSSVNSSPSTPCARQGHTSAATTPASPCSPCSYKSSEAGSIPNSPQLIETDSEMTPDTSSSRSQSGGGSRRSSHSYTGLPPTPRIESLAKVEAHMDLDRGLQSLAIQSLPVTATTTIDDDQGHLDYYNEAIKGQQDGHAHYEVTTKRLYHHHATNAAATASSHHHHHQQQQSQVQVSRFGSMPTRRSLKKPAPITVSTRKLRNNLFGA